MQGAAERITEKSVEGHWRFLAWSVLGDDRITHEEKLKTFRHIRSLGVLPEEATFFLIESLISTDHEERRHDDAEMIQIEKEMTVIEERFFGIPDPGRGPKRYRLLEKRWEARNKVLLTEAFRRQGEEDMARLHEEDEVRFDGLSREGGDYFYRVYKPEWTSEAAARRVEAGQRALRAEA